MSIGSCVVGFEDGILIKNGSSSFKIRNPYIDDFNIECSISDTPTIRMTLTCPNVEFIEDMEKLTKKKKTKKKEVPGLLEDLVC